MKKIPQRNHAPTISHPMVLQEDAHINNEENSEATPTRARHKPTRRPRNHQRVGTWMACLLLFVSIVGIMGSAVAIVAKEKHMPTTKDEWGRAVGHLLLCVGLPDLQSPLLGTDQPTLQLPQDTSTSTTPPETSLETEPETQVPHGGWQVVAVDMSLWGMGAFHWQGDTGCVPPSVTDMDGFFEERKPTILLVCSHPYAIFGQGQDVIDATQSNFGVAQPTGDALPIHGVVSLAETWCQMLCDAGLDAVVLACATGDSYTQTYQDTARRVSAYLAEHPEVGVVIDISRSAELMPSGEVPRSMTTWEGQPCAQVQIQIDTGRGVAAAGDYTFARAWRQVLFEMAPTLSRPVYISRGVGLTTQDRVVCLTLEMGTVGNTFEEAQRLLSPLTHSLAELLLPAD